MVGGGIEFSLVFSFKTDKNRGYTRFSHKDAVIMEDDFKSVCSAVHIATDDGATAFTAL